MKIDPQLKRAISLGLSWIGLAFMITGIEKLLENTGFSPTALAEVNPLVPIAVGIGLTWAFIEWGIRK